MGYDGNGELGNGMRVQDGTQYATESQGTWQEVQGLTDIIGIDAAMHGLELLLRETELFGHGVITITVSLV